MKKALILILLSIASLLALPSARMVKAQAPVASLPLSQIETNPQSSVIDLIHGFAYFGTSGSIVKVSLSNFTRLGAIDTGYANLASALIDPTAGFAYFGSVGNCPARCTPGDVIIRIRLSDFSIDGTLTLSSGEPGPLPSAIDPASGFAYYAPNPSNTIVKVRLSDFTQVATLTLSPNPGNIESASIDLAAGFAYFGTYSQPGSVVKVRLSDFTEIGSLTMNPGEDDLVTSVIDPASGFLYFGTYTSPGIVVKIRLSDFTRVGALTLNLGENSLDSSTVDPTEGFGYFVSFNYYSPGIVLKVRLQDLTLNASLIFNRGELNPETSVIDPPSGFVYVGTETSDGSPGKIVQVKLADLTRVQTILLDPGESYVSSSVIDLKAGYAYFGASTVPGVLARIRLSTFTEAGSLILGPSITGSQISSIGRGVIDPAGGFAYFAVDTTGVQNTASIVKVRLSNFTIAGFLVLKTNECCLGTAVIDSTAGFVYFGGSLFNGDWTSSPGLVVKIRLSDFTEAGSLVLSQGESGISTSVIDTTAGFAYFANTHSPGIVVKVNLSNFSRIGNLTLNLGTDSVLSSVIDPVAGFAYFGTGGNQVVKVRLADFAMVGKLTLAVSESFLTTAAVDPAAGFAYFDTYGGLVKIRLSDFTRVDAVQLGPAGSYSTMVIDPGAGFLYVSTNPYASSTSVIVKVDLNAPPPPPFDYTLANSGNVTTAQGSTGITTITAILKSGVSQSVTLHCIGFLPTGVSCSFNPSTLTPTDSSTLDISASLSTPTGSYTIQVAADPQGSTATSTSFTLTVTTPGTGSGNGPGSNNGPSLPNTVSALLGNRTVLYGIIGALVIIGVGAALLLRKRKSHYVS